MQISKLELTNLCQRILAAQGFTYEHQVSIANNLVKAEMDNCPSHGVWRLLGIIDTLKNGKISPDSVPEVILNQGAIIKLDAKMGPATTAHGYGFPILINKAKQLGIAALAINHCVHFSALWVELEQLAKEGLIAIAMTAAHSWVAPFGSKTPLLGTNPFGFACPRENSERPYVFDFATTNMARGEISLYERKKHPLPEGVAINANGEPTTDPSEALKGAMLPFGGHKGSAIATMIELLSGIAIGDMTSKESTEFSEERNSLPYGGELIIAVDPYLLLGEDDKELENFYAKQEKFYKQFQATGARLPSQRRFAAREENEEKDYLEIDDTLYQELMELVPENA